MIRLGQGYDSHRFVPGRPCIIGGVRIPHSHGLAGHSDADPVAHALIDAMLGAAVLGDIGALFPDTDPAWKDADSMLLLAQANQRIQAAGWQVAHVDVTVILQAPRLSPHIESIREHLANSLAIPIGVISVKAKTNENMGFIGRGEGVATLAVATLTRR